VSITERLQGDASSMDQISPEAMMRTWLSFIRKGPSRVEVPKNLPSFDDSYQMYTGVLDTLRR
jgi:hypothetical protein